MYVCPPPPPPPEDFLWLLLVVAPQADDSLAAGSKQLPEVIDRFPQDGNIGHTTGPTLTVSQYQSHLITGATGPMCQHNAVDSSRLTGRHRRWGKFHLRPPQGQPPFGKFRKRPGK